MTYSQMWRHSMTNTKIFAVLGLIVFFACKTPKDNSTGNDQENTGNTQEENLETKILGSWEWLMTKCCYRTPRTYTSDTLAYKRILRFRKNGVLEYFNGDTLKKTASYEVGYGLMDDDRPVLNIDDTRPALLHIQNDTLIIDYGYIDLQTEFYRRSKD